MSRSAKVFTRFWHGALAALVALAALGRAALAGDLSGWKPVEEGGGKVELLQDAATPDAQHPHSWHLTIQNPGVAAGLVSDEVAGVNVQTGQWYDLTFQARTEGRATFALTVSLTSLDGKIICARATIPEVGHQWADYHLALAVRQSQPKCRLTITVAEPGALWLDQISLAPRP